MRKPRLPSYAMITIVTLQTHASIGALQAPPSEGVLSPQKSDGNYMSAAMQSPSPG